MMQEREEGNLDELLNTFVDGECSERQSIELRRLIAHDREVAGKVLELQKCKALVMAMERHKAPDDVSEHVRARVERTVLLKEYDRNHHHAGAVHLFARKMIASAAMLALVGVLAVVIYSIVGRHGTREEVVVNTYSHSASAKAVSDKAKAETRPAIASAPKREAISDVAAMPVNMDLELWTDQYIAVTSYMYRSVIVDNGLLDSSNVARQENKSTYTITCSRAQMNTVLDDLESAWNKFTMTRLSMGKQREGAAAVIEGVNAGQMMQILTQRTVDEQIKLARDFSSMNLAGAKHSADELYAAAAESNMPGISKPVLTSGEKPAAAKESDAVEKINFVITVYGNK